MGYQVSLVKSGLLSKIGEGDKTTVPAAYSMALFQGYLYLAVTYQGLVDNGSQVWGRISRSNLETGSWEVVHTLSVLEIEPSSLQNLSKLTKEQNANHSDGKSTPLAHSNAFSDMVVWQGETNAVLYVSLGCSFGSQLLYSADGKTFNPVPVTAPLNLDSDLEIGSYSRFCTGKDQLYGVPVGTNREALGIICVADSPVQGKWQTISSLGLGDLNNSSVTQMIEFNGHLYAGTLNQEQGFQVWKTQANQPSAHSWQEVLLKGAYRYTLNAATLSMAVFKDSLYLASGISSASMTQDNGVQATAFEVIRIYADDSWDLIVGTPRFTPDGLKVPLSTMGPGFDQLDSTFQFMHVHEKNLCVGVQVKDQLQLWTSADAETWEYSTLETFSKNSQVQVSTALSTPVGIVLVSEITETTSAERLTPEVSKASSGTRKKKNRRQKILGDSVSGTITNLSSLTTRMITHRHQRHLWLAEDNVLHTVINQGKSTHDTSLAICSSYDDGKTWENKFLIDYTNENSTSDGVLSGSSLFLVYPSLEDEIFFSHFDYNPKQQTWTSSQTSLVYGDEDAICLIPTVTTDAQGQLWCAFIHQSRSTSKLSLKLFYSTDNGAIWHDTGTTLGSANNSPAKSGLLVALPDRVGIIYTDQSVTADSQVVRTRNYAYRMNDWSLTEAWVQEPIFQHENVEDLKEGQFGSHFSVGTDPLGNIHVATQDAGRLLYLRFNTHQQSWDPPVILTDDQKIAYVKVSFSTSENRLFLICNVKNFIRIYESLDYGDSFQASKFLLHPLDDTLDFSLPRMEAPSKIQDQLPVLQQFQAKRSWGLICFDVKLKEQAAEAVHRK